MTMDTFVGSEPGTRRSATACRSIHSKPHRVHYKLPSHHSMAWGRHSTVRQAKSFPTSLQQASLLKAQRGAGVLSDLEVWRFDWRASHGRVLSCEGQWSYIRTA